MATEKQIEANRNNAQLSTGPKTPEGKEAVRLNALRHGLRAESFDVAPGEDPAEFAARLDGWNRTYAPANPVEADLVRNAVILSWRIDRAVRFENSTLAQRVRDSVNACDCDDNDRESLIEAAGLALFDAGKDGEKLRRYQFALHRDLHRILAELAKLRGLTARRNPKELSGAIAANLEEVAIPPVEATRRSHPSPEAPAPIKANSPAPIKANFEEILNETRSRKTPNYAKGSSWLNISCLKS